MYFFLKQNSKNQKRIEKSFYAWFAIVPITCVILDLLLSTIEPNFNEGKDGKYLVNFDNSIISQSLYLSVGAAMATFLYGLLNGIHLNHENMPLGIVGKNNLTRVTAINIMTFMIYNSQLIISTITRDGSGMVGFDTGYNIFKSVFEHMLTPLFLVIFYFTIPKGIVDNKMYMKKYCGFNLLLIGLYSTYILLRAAMLLNYYPTNSELEPFHPFPYSQIDLRKLGGPLFSFAMIWILLAPVGLGIGINYLSNILFSKKTAKIENGKLNNLVENK